MSYQRFENILGMSVLHSLLNHYHCHLSHSVLEKLHYRHGVTLITQSTANSAVAWIPSNSKVTLKERERARARAKWKREREKERNRKWQGGGEGEGCVNDSFILSLYIKFSNIYTSNFKLQNSFQLPWVVLIFLSVCSFVVWVRVLCSFVVWVRVYLLCFTGGYDFDLYKSRGFGTNARSPPAKNFLFSEVSKCSLLSLLNTNKTTGHEHDIWIYIYICTLHNFIRIKIFLLCMNIFSSRMFGRSLRQHIRMLMTSAPMIPLMILRYAYEFECWHECVREGVALCTSALMFLIFSGPPTASSLTFLLLRFLSLRLNRGDSTM